MLDIDYEQGLEKLRALVERQRPELSAEFHVYEARLLKRIPDDRRYGQGSDARVELNIILDQLMKFTTTYFSLQFIDLCRSERLPAVPVRPARLPSPETAPAQVWQGGSEVIVHSIRYLIQEPIESLEAADQSALRQRARALALDANQPALLKQVLLRRPTGRAESWKTALEKEGRLLEQLEPQQRFPRRLAFEQTTRGAVLVQSVVPGQSWQQYFGLSGKPLATRWVRPLLSNAVALCGLLQVLHARRLAHRALTPDEILWLDTRNARLRDTGLAAWTFEVGEGPALYRAPEQALTTLAVSSSQTDIYQLGMILYHLLTGKVPPSPQQALPLHVWNPALPEVPELDTTLQRAIAPKARERWRTISEFSFALRQVLPKYSKYS